MFGGWYKEAECQNKWDFAKDTVTGNITLYAKWTAPAQKWTVRFDSRDGSSVSDQAVNDGGKVSRPANPTRSGGYNFSGWYKEAACENPWNFDKDVVKENITLYAKWTPGNCYIASSVYGSYDCSEVWTLRRFRDEVLAETWYGRLFIKAYYATSPTLVRLFGDTDIFRNFWRDKLDNMVSGLQSEGFASTPYRDRDW